MVDKSSLGVEGATYDMHVERGKVREFARAVHADLQVHSAGDHPVIPPTFLESMRHWAEGVENANLWPRTHIDERRGMHAEQEYVFHGPPPKVGDELTVQSKITEIYDKEGRRGGKLTFVVMRTEFRDAAGKLVAEGKTTAVETEKVEG